MKQALILKKSNLKGHNMERPKQEIIDYMVALQMAGVTHMLNAGPLLEDEFDINRYEAKKIVIDWMKNCGKYLKEKGLV